jgi:hypothetical protein
MNGEFKNGQWIEPLITTEKTNTETANNCDIIDVIQVLRCTISGIVENIDKIEYKLDLIEKRIDEIQKQKPSLIHRLFKRS